MAERPNIEELELVTYPDPRLREKAKPVEEIDDYISRLAEKMIEMTLELEGIGLAGNQVGCIERIVVVVQDGDPDQAEAFINPRIVSQEGYYSDEEGCLSLPGLRCKVRRAAKVTVKATPASTGEEIEIEAEDLMAKVWQHEIDHLNGNLFVDKVGVASKISVAKQLRRMEESKTGTAAGR